MKQRNKLTSSKAVFGLALVLCLFAGMVLPLLPAEPAEADATWQIQIIDNAGNVGDDTSIAFDHSGNPAISYPDTATRALKFARWNGSSWDIEAVDSTAISGKGISLSFDLTGNPAISYHDETNKDLKFAHWNGTSWNIETVDSAGIVGYHTSLAFDPYGNPAISYRDATNQNLKFARWNGSSWDIETVDTASYVGDYTSLAFDTSGNPAISYYDAWQSALKFAHWNGATWNIESVDSSGNVGLYTSLAFDSSGNPAISYYDATNQNLKFAHWNGSSWNIESVGNMGHVGKDTSLAFDSLGYPAITYYESVFDDALKFAHWNGVTWNIETVDATNNTGHYTSLAFDTLGNPAISYFDYTNCALKYAYLPFNQPPNQPSNQLPLDGVTDTSLTPTLQSSAFSDPDSGDTHAASQWQITTTSGDYSSPVYDSGADSSQLTAISIPGGTLDYNTTYYWHVRHQDNHGAWSGWSEETCFNTTTGIPQLEWHRTFGGSAKDYADSVQQTSDGGYIIVGQTESYGAGENDVWLIRMDSNGNELWDKTFGGSATDYGESVQQTSDGGYIIAGTTASYGAGGPADVWLIKTDSEGNKLWDETFGGSLNDYGKSVQQTADGGYVIVGDTWSSGAGEMDVWLIKTDSNGNKVWDKTFGSTDIDWGKSVQQTADGGYVIAAVKAHSADYKGDAWLIKTNSSGNKLWDKTFGDSGDDFGYSVQQTSDGGYIIGGTTESYGAGDSDVWLIRTDSNGDQLWDKTFGGPDYDSAQSVQQTSDGGYVIAGYTVSYGAGDCDVWLLKVSNPPDQPSNTSPSNGATGLGLTPTLESTPFSDPDSGDTHASSQWQITTTSGDYSSPVFDSNTDTSNLTSITIPSETLDYNTTYYWHVRHQDNSAAWSSWSSEAFFSTANSAWPMFRHDPQHTGRSPYTGPEVPELKWSYTAGDMISSSPAIGADGTIYVSSNDNKLYAINPDGSLKWSYTAGDMIRSSPAIGTDGVIYVGSEDNKLHAVNPDGSLKWSYTTGDRIGSTPPAIGADGTIYVSSNDNKLYAINPDGSLKWSYTAALFHSGSSPAIGTDGTIYTRSLDNFWAINWSYVTELGGPPSPAIGADGTIYTGSCLWCSYDDNFYAINPDGSLKWSYTIYDDNFYAINPDGSLKWSYTIGDAIDSSPAIGADGTIYVGSYDGKLYAIDPDGTLKWSYATGYYVHSSPAIGADGTIYVGSYDNNLYAINSDGSFKWSFATGDMIISSPAIGADGTIYVGSSDGKLYAIGAAENQPPNQPSNTWPLDGATGVSLLAILQSSAFSDPDSGDTHAASQWQITATSGYYSSPVFDSGTDTSKLTSITISSGTLQHAITYYWRVRHQDNHGAWSEWSDETQFTREGMVVVDGGQEGEDESESIAGKIADWARDNWSILAGAVVEFLLLMTLALSIALRRRRQTEIKGWKDEGYRW